MLHSCRVDKGPLRSIDLGAVIASREEVPTAIIGHGDARMPEALLYHPLAGGRDPVFGLPATRIPALTCAASRLALRAFECSSGWPDDVQKTRSRAADGYTHVECYCPRCRMTRLRPISWLPRISMGLNIAQLSTAALCEVQRACSLGQALADAGCHGQAPWA